MNGYLVIVVRLIPGISQPKTVTIKSKSKGW